MNWWKTVDTPDVKLEQLVEDAERRLIGCDVVDGDVESVGRSRTIVEGERKWFSVLSRTAIESCGRISTSVAAAGLGGDVVEGTDRHGTQEFDWLMLIPKAPSSRELYGWCQMSTRKAAICHVPDG